MRWVIVSALGAAAAIAFADFSETLPPAGNHPAIQYSRREVQDPVAKLNTRLNEGKAKLAYEQRAGFLGSVLRELDVPVESQVVVFSKTSLQGKLISPTNPRTIFFNDQAAVAWMGGGFIELAAQDPAQGTVFYTLAQDGRAETRFLRNDSCLTCHQGDASLGVPGWISRSVYAGPGGEALLIYGDTIPDHRTKFEDRWGGWFVTGAVGGAKHMGNAMVTDRDRPRLSMTGAVITSLDRQFDTTKYLSAHSDAAALLVLDHQVHMSNLLTRYGWEVRVARAEIDDGGRRAMRVISDGAREVAEYMLFTHEQPLPGRVGGTSGFAKAFAARGPLYELDLNTRLLKHRLSYMIASPTFDALPAEAREAVYKLIWEALSKRGAEGRGAIEALRATKAGLPDYFSLTADSVTNGTAPSSVNTRRK